MSEPTICPNCGHVIAEGKEHIPIPDSDVFKSCCVDADFANDLFVGDVMRKEIIN